MNRPIHYAVVASSACIVGALLFGTVTAHSATPDDSPYTQLMVFSEVLTKIKLEYVEEPDLKAVTMGAVNGLLESLDPFASFLSADQYRQYQAEHGKNKADVGLILSRGPGYLRIVDTLPGSAADKAGLATGDVIESINKVSTRDMPLASAEMLLQGDAGTIAELSVLTPKQTDPQIMKLARAPLAYPAISAKLMADKTSQQVGLVTVGALLEGRSKEIGQKVQDLEKQGAKRIILDLRDCAVGPVEEGAAVADLFMESGLITYTQGQKLRRTDVNAVAGSVTKLPLTVLTNRGTVGGAEVAAYALQASKRAKIVGEPTFGDAAVRKAVNLPDGSAVIMAVAKFYTPGGKSIQEAKMTPDVLQIQTPVVTDDDAVNETPNPKAGPQSASPTPAKAPQDMILDKALLPEVK